MERAGFAVELTNYGRLDLFKFLLPIWAFRLTAIDRVREQISIAITRHPGERVSFIAHSFGAFVLGHILRAAMGLKIDRIILCGSVLPYDFPFGKIAAAIVNEVGGRDFLPAIAERVTWGYGSAGTYGARVPGVRDRYHNKLPHSAFLRADFCRKYWVPFLWDGTNVEGDSASSRPNLVMSAALLLLNKYLLIAMAVLGLIWNDATRGRPISIDIMASNGYAFLGQPISDLIASMRADTCVQSSVMDAVRQRRCVEPRRVDSGTTDLVLCTPPGRSIQLSDRDPVVVLQRLAEVVPYLRVGLQERELSIELDDRLISEVRSNDATYRLCGCTDDAVQTFEKQFGK